MQCLEKMLNSNEIGKEYDAMRAEVTSVTENVLCSLRPAGIHGAVEPG